MAIDFPASPTNGQTFTSGSVTYTWDGTKWTAVAAAGSSNSISQGNTNATVTDTGSDGRFVVTTEGSERLRVDSSGRLGVGTASPGGVLEAGAVSGSVTSGDLLVTTGSTTARVTVGRLSGTSNDNTSFRVRNRVDSTLFQVDSTAVTFGPTGTEAARIDSSGRLLVGTASAPTGANSQYGRFVVSGNTFDGTSNARISLRFGSTAASLGTGGTVGDIFFTDGSGNDYASILAARDTSGTSAGRLVFSTTADGASSPTERFRVGSLGMLYSLSADDACRFSTTWGAGQSYALIRGRHSGSSVGGGTESFTVYSNGNVQNSNNSYGAISDVKLKENIVDANSQWNDLKALQVRNYNFKEGQTHTQIGLVAQEVELVSPGLVTESPDRDAEGNDLGTVTKSVNYSVLYMKAVKALQEAMERIETLEAKVAALESA